MELNKKGIFFTMIAIILLGAALLILTLSKEMPQKQEIELNELRITKINDFIIDLEESYIPQIASTAGEIKAGPLWTPGPPSSWAGGATTDIQYEIKTKLENQLIPLKNIVDSNFDMELSYAINSVTASINIDPIEIEINANIAITSDLATWTRNNIIIETTFPHP